MPEYDGTTGKMRAYRKSDDGKQAGDRNKAVEVILNAVASNKPPLYLPLGERAYSLARTKIEAFTAVIDAWEKEATATGF